MSQKTAEDYIIRVRSGPSYDKNTLTTCHVNDEHNPTLINGPNFCGHLCVRMVNFTGIVPAQHAADGPIKNPESEYFKGRNRRYSLVLQGRFKHITNGDDILFGLDSDTTVRMPTGIGVAVKIAKWLDPAVEADPFSTSPYIYSPLLCAMNALGIFDPSSPEVNDTDQQTGKLIADFIKPPLSKITIGEDELKPDLPCGKWSFHSRMVPENVSLLVNDSRYTSNFVEEPSGWFGGSSKKKESDTKVKKVIDLGSYEKRKKYFADQKRRQNVTISPDHVYCMDFYDAYFDVNTISLKLPGVSISAFKYWDGQPLRFVAKSKSDPSIIYFTVWFDILDREELGIEPGDPIPKPASIMFGSDRLSIDNASIHQVPLDVLQSAQNLNLDDDEEVENFEDAKE